MNWVKVSTLDPYQIAEQRSKKRLAQRRYRARKAGKPYPPPLTPPSELPPLPVIIERPRMPESFRRMWEAINREAEVRHGGKEGWKQPPTPQEQWDREMNRQFPRTTGQSR